jgi:hypothetical protein
VRGRRGASSTRVAGSEVERAQFARSITGAKVERRLGGWSSSQAGRARPQMWSWTKRPDKKSKEEDAVLPLRMKTVELGRKTPQLFSIFIFKIRKRTSRTRKRTRTYEISKISETNQFERNYVEQYTKIQYEIPTHSA